MSINRSFGMQLTLNSVTSYVMRAADAKIGFAG